jgi:hypothetical protein
LQPTQQDVGGTKGEDTQWFRMHDSGRSTQLRDGMFIGTPMGGANFNSAVNPATIEEVTVQLTGSLTAEVMGDGPQTNFVPRDGGNIFSGSFSTDFGNSACRATTSLTTSARGAPHVQAICGGSMTLAAASADQFARDRCMVLRQQPL